jgi:hypothetical protein
MRFELDSRHKTSINLILAEYMHESYNFVLSCFNSNTFITRIASVK